MRQDDDTAISPGARAYQSLVLGHPGAVLAVLALILSFFAWHARDFQLDASADSLLLEDDQDLRLYREVRERYPSKDLLVVTFSPRDELFSEASLARLKRLGEELRPIDGVDSVLSLIEVPLLKNEADRSLIEAVQNITTLEDPRADLQRAKSETLESPIYRNLVLSPDGRTTAILVELQDDPRYSELLRTRTALRDKRRAGELSDAERSLLEATSAEYDALHSSLNAQRHRIVEQIRTVMRPYREFGTLYLGGVPMITDDMVSFVGNDLVVFGSGVLVFLIVVLTLIFRELRWIVLPLLSCFYAGLLMIGLLGLIGWKVTVISSNFLALMLIITISMNIHLIVRYRQLCRDFPDLGQDALVATTARKMVRPCLYTALTTIMGFSSLVVSDIKPVIDFGWMMSAGLAVTFLTSFTLFPAILVLLPRSPVRDTTRREFRVPHHLASITERHGGKVLVLSVVLAALSLVGISRLKVENSFISYFRDDTEISQGLTLIDRELGGTTPLEILEGLEEDTGLEGLEHGPALSLVGISRLKVENSFISYFRDDTEISQGLTLIDRELGGTTPLEILVRLEEDTGLEELDDDPTLSEEDRELLELERQYAQEVASSPEYWFTPFKVERIKEVHDYLDGLPEVGKVLSLASVVRVGEDLNRDEEFDSFQLSLLFKRAPEELRASTIDPYVSFERSEARLFVRVVDSREDLRRKELLERIERDLTGKLGFAAEDVTVTGLLVLYNNMLQSLFRSQISTLGVVMLGIAIMFLVLFRSVTLSVIGIVPNLMGAVVVLGIMGWLDVPLDMMTITIAAISIGIAVDNGIHYIYRFREEYAHNHDYIATLHLCHSNIGKAVVYTTITIIFGFSILVLSNFIPTIYFGVLTALAMFIALLAALTLLPKLILAWRPFG